MIDFESFIFDLKEFHSLGPEITKLNFLIFNLNLSIYRLEEFLVRWLVGFALMNCLNTQGNIELTYLNINIPIYMLTRSINFNVFIFLNNGAV